MFRKLLLSASIALGVSITAGFTSTDNAIASADKVWDAGTRTWVNPPRVALNQRKPNKKYNRRDVRISTKLAPGTIVIHTDKKFLYFVESNGKATRYGVGVGKEGFDWNGEVTIKRKAEWPTWTPPKEMILRERAEGRELPASMKGGPENPLGARALYLYQGNRDTLYRIHGTHQPWSIGLNLSSGCIRMLNKDVEHLYGRVKLGSKVLVVGKGKRLDAFLTEINNPLAALFAPR